MSKRVLSLLLIVCMVAAILPTAFAASPAPVMYTVEAVSAGNGQVSGGGAYEENQYASVTATPDHGYYFYGWFIDDACKSTDLVYVFKVTKDIQVVAKFTPNRGVDPSAKVITTEINIFGAGTVTGYGVYMPGTEATVTAYPAVGYRFLYWTEAGVPVCYTPEYSFTVADSRTLVAVFEQTSYTDTVGEHCVVSLDTNMLRAGSVDGYGTYVSGSSVTVTASPNYGYKFLYWVESGTIVSMQERYTFTVTTDVTLTAVFEGTLGDGGYVDPYPSYYNITKIATDNGRVSVSTSARAGTTVTIYPTANAGYKVYDVYVWSSLGAVAVSENRYGNYTFLMPSSHVWVEVMFVPKTASAPAQPGYGWYYDVSPYDWYYNGVMWVARRNLMPEVTSTWFNANGTATRAMLVTALYRLEGEPYAGAYRFSDVPRGSYYYDAVSWAASKGIVGGYGNGRFGPNDAITREQMVTIFCRYAAYKRLNINRPSDLSEYRDAKYISNWASSSMQWAHATGLITGRTGTMLAPQGISTRAELSTVITRFCQNILGMR